MTDSTTELPPHSPSEQSPREPPVSPDHASDEERNRSQAEQTATDIANG